MVCIYNIAHDDLFNAPKRIEPLTKSYYQLKNYTFIVSKMCTLCKVNRKSNHSFTFQTNAKVAFYNNINWTSSGFIVWRGAVELNAKRNVIKSGHTDDDYVYISKWRNLNVIMDTLQRNNGEIIR